MTKPSSSPRTKTAAATHHAHRGHKHEPSARAQAFARAVISPIDEEQTKETAEEQPIQRKAHDEQPTRAARSRSAEKSAEKSVEQPAERAAEQPSEPASASEERSWIERKVDDIKRYAQERVSGVQRRIAQIRSLPTRTLRTALERTRDTSEQLLQRLAPSDAE